MVRISAAANARKRNLSRPRFPVHLYVVAVALCAAVALWYTPPPKERKGAAVSRQPIKTPASRPQVRKTGSFGSGPTVGYVVSVTGCGSDPITEGAAVLKHSIHQASLNGDYGYKMYAIVHPVALSCGLTLKDLGFEILQRETPVAVEDIEGEYYRTAVVSDGCCGEKELIKLEAYTLVQHPVVVHLDLDTLILKPLDGVFDMMLKRSSPSEAGVTVMWKDEPIPETINAFFTRDYNMANPGKKYKPVQGGFLVLRPSLEVYKEFQSIIRKGDYQKGKGWGGLVGRFYGSMTFQGLIPYYYDILHPNSAVELNRCLYNQMCDNPRTEKTVDDVVHGKCRTGEDECEDCRSRPLEDVYSTHFTLCQKPWLCMAHDNGKIQHRLCRRLHHEWFRVRSDMEQSWGRSEMGNGSYQKEQFFGYCRRGGQSGYQQIARPYGEPIE